MAAPREVVTIDGLPVARAQLEPQQFREMLRPVALDAFDPIVADTRQRSPRGRTGKTARSVRAELRVRGLDFEVVLGTGKPTGHLVERGHRIVPRGPSRTRLSITSVRVSKRTGKQVVRTRWGLDPTARQSLRTRRATAHGFVAARPFAEPAYRAGQEQLVAAIERNLGLVLGWT